VGSPHHPLPWSEDGTGEYLVTPSETRELLAAARFAEIEIEDTWPKYLAAYSAALELADRGELPPLGLHVLLGPMAPVDLDPQASATKVLGADVTEHAGLRLRDFQAARPWYQDPDGNKLAFGGPPLDTAP
jgi:hypothetical protein